MTEAPEIKVGQIWQEVDPRFERFIRIEQVGNARRSIQVRTVERHLGDGAWVATRRSRRSHCDYERFNGKRGGYRLIEEPQS